MPRFSLKWFFILPTMVGLLTGAVIYPARWLVVLGAIAVWGSLVIAAISSVTSGAKRRPFSAGYAIAGFAFFIVALNPGGFSRDTRQVIHDNVVMPLHAALPLTSAFRRDLTQTTSVVQLGL